MSEITTKKPSSGKGAEKLVSFEELLNLSTIKLNDAGYRDLIANELYRIMLESANVLHSNIAYSELIIPIEVKIKVLKSKFIKIIFLEFFEKIQES